MNTNPPLREDSGFHNDQNVRYGDTATAAASPITFAVADGYCFGWFHAASVPTRNAGIVLCRPIGYEAICTNGCYTQLAEALALEGFDIIRFDYQGCGDSTGDDTDPHRVEAWLSSITQAADELKRLSGVLKISVFGLRLGAALATHAALRMGGVDSLVLWAPCAGKGFVRELRVASQLRPVLAGKTNTGDIEALGFYYSAQTLRDLHGLDCLAVERAPATRALILGRESFPADEKLKAGFERLGMKTTYAEVSGFAEMVVEPRETLMPANTLAVLTQWLLNAYPLQTGLTVVPARPILASCQWAWQGWRESAVHFGTDRLFGVLSEPAGMTAPDSRQETAVLLLNVGGNYHIGPNRIYSRMARWLAEKGWRALRMDLGGIGDSRNAQGFDFRSLYARDATAEVSAAIDFLALGGCKRFYLVGICSGSFVAFQSAIADARVTGQILMNSRLLEWREDFQSDEWQNAMQRYYKSTDFYRRALTHPAVYLRLLRGQVDAVGISQRIASVLTARIKRFLTESLGKTVRQQGVLSRVQTLAARNTDTLIVMAAEDDGRDYVEFHFGHLGSRLRGNPLFHMVIVENADHTFSDLASQSRVFAAIANHLDKTACGADAGATTRHKKMADDPKLVSA